MSGNLRLLTDTLARAKQENRAALITYMTAGFPTVNQGIAAIQAMLNSGADIVEVGLPHSDPVLDGPVIQAADDIALRGGVRIADVIRTVLEAYQVTGKPVLVMSYWNPINRYGPERFSSELAEAGGAGCILPDLPVQESARWRESAARHGLATIFVAAPSTTDERLRELTAAGTGFVYASSLMGVTGVREAVNAAASSLVRRIRATTELPVCVGIGISNVTQAAQVAGFADGVIVASTLVKAILDAPDAAAAAAAVVDLTAELSLATHRHALTGHFSKDPAIAAGGDQVETGTRAEPGDTGHQRREPAVEFLIVSAAAVEGVRVSHRGHREELLDDSRDRRGALSQRFLDHILDVPEGGLGADRDRGVLHQPVIEVLRLAHPVRAAQHRDVGQRIRALAVGDRGRVQPAVFGHPVYVRAIVETGKHGKGGADVLGPDGDEGGNRPASRIARAETHSWRYVRVVDVYLNCRTAGSGQAFAQRRIVQRRARVITVQRRDQLHGHRRSLDGSTDPPAPATISWRASTCRSKAVRPSVVSRAEVRGRLPTKAFRIST